MYLQGNLQLVFDALNELGIIDPVLTKDWNKELENLSEHYADFSAALRIANYYQSDKQILLKELKKINESGLSYLAMEVAREFADFHSRQVLH